MGNHNIWEIVSPHNYADNSHNDFIENLKKVNHDFRLFSHLSDNDAECDAENNYSCNKVWRNIIMRYVEHLHQVLS